MRNHYLFIAFSIFFSIPGRVQTQTVAFSNRNANNDPVPGSCTIFSASKGDQVLFGNNEDYNDPKTYFWTEPAGNENYGAVYVGYENYSYQGGINDKGLCFDANALPGSKLNPDPDLAEPPFYRAPYDNYPIWAPVLILRKAANVEEAIKIASKYQRKN